MWETVMAMVILIAFGAMLWVLAYKNPGGPK